MLLLDGGAMHHEALAEIYLAPSNDDRFCCSCGLPVANKIVADIDLEGYEAIHESCLDEEQGDD